jgi:hypothetical protein
MLMESVEEGCHFNGTPNYRDCEEDISMCLALPLLGVDSGKAVSESNLDHSSTDLCCEHKEGYWLIDVVGETNLRTINITFEDKVLSNFYFATQVLLQCKRFFISRSIICQFFVTSMSWLRKV